MEPNLDNLPEERRELNSLRNYTVLVRMEENLKYLTSEFKEMKENQGGRLTELERSATKFKDLEALRSAFFEALKELTDDGKRRDAQIELLTRYFWMAIGALTVFQSLFILLQDKLKTLL